MNEKDLQELMQAETFVSDEELAIGGFTVVDRTDAGMVAHRGVLHPDEYIDPDTLREAAEAALGYAYAEVSAAYKGGRPSAEQRQLREKIDSRLLALSRAGGNMTRLGEVLGLSHSTVERALARAKEREVLPIVADPAVVTRRGCFKCDQEGTPRQRRFNEQFIDAKFRGMRPTITLCDEHYAAGFILVRTGGGVKAVKRHVNAVGLIKDKDTRTFGGHRHYGPPWVPARDR